MLKIISWNVNGVRSLYRSGFIDFLEREKPDILCLQETKAHPDQCERPLLQPLGYQSYWSSAHRRGYSGVATYVREGAIPDLVQHGIGLPHFDGEGRFVITRHPPSASSPGFTLFNIYFPNGGSGPERHQYKQDFLKALLLEMQTRLQAGESLIVVGDYNIAHQSVDIHDPVRLATHSGFLPEERAWMSNFLQAGFVDTFRAFYPQAREAYTWWDMRTRARLSNKGWRIDYICTSKDLQPRLQAAGIMNQQLGSDHCPVWIHLQN